jgi:RNA polymerase sigma factor (sigma-70 family)
MPFPIDTDGALFEQLRPRLTAISCHIVGSQAEAEDVVQDSFLKWRGVEQAAVATPAAWLTTVVRHLSIDRLRKRARDAGAAQLAVELVPETPPALPEDGLLRLAELEEGLAHLLQCLSPSERLALVLREVFDCDHADVAAALGTSVVNARQHLARARRRLSDDKNGVPDSEKRCRQLVRQFQAAINNLDMPALVSLLAEEQPVWLLAPARLPLCAGAAANQAVYRPALRA